MNHIQSGYTNKEPPGEKLSLNFPGPPCDRDLSSGISCQSSCHSMGRGWGSYKLSGLVLGLFSIYQRLANLLETRAERKTRPGSQHDLHRLGTGDDLATGLLLHRLCVLLPFVATQTVSGK